MSKKKNAPYLNIWDRMDIWEPHEPDVTSKQLVEYRRSFLGTILGLRVWGVDGFSIRSTKDIDFTIGGNPARYRYVPNDEVWIEFFMSPPDALCTAVHEGIETILMIKGLPYDKAHDLSNIFEWSLRRELLLGRVETPTTHQKAVAVADEWLRAKLKTLKKFLEYSCGY